MNRYSRDIIFLIFVLTVFSCGERKSNDSTFYINTNSISQISISDSNFVVKDSRMYDRSFLDSLKNSGYAKTYKISDATLILDRIDTVYFPVNLPFGEFAELTGSKDNKHYFLMLKQINYTTIRFGLAISENSELVEKLSGNVNLRPLFFLGAESDEDNMKGISYLSTEYVNSNNDCSFSIRIGKNETSDLLVKIKRSCNDSTKNIDLDKSPVFRRTTTPANIEFGEMPASE